MSYLDAKFSKITVLVPMSKKGVALRSDLNREHDSRVSNHISIMQPTFENDTAVLG